MTVTEKSSRKLISGTGWTNPLTHDFELENSTHLKVYADDTLLVLGVNYTVSGVGSDSGYSVTISTPGVWTAVSTWVLSVEPPISQADDISLGGTYGARFEDGLDALTRRVQRLRDDARRAFKAPRTTVVGDAPTMDVLAEGEFWVADANRNMVRGGDAGDIANAQGYASAAAASAVDAQTAENGAVVAQLAAEAAAASATIFGTDVLAAAPGAAENYVAGTVFSTAGKSVSGDGGGGRWLVAASDPGNTLKLNLNGSGKYAKSLEKVLRPAHFGAAAGGTDQQQAFIDMASEIRWRAANGGGVRVEFDDYKDYGVYDTGTPAGNELMRLAGRGIKIAFNGSRILCANDFDSASQFLFLITGQSLEDLEISDYRVEQTAATTLRSDRGIYGVYIGGEFRDIKLSGKQIGGAGAFAFVPEAYSGASWNRSLRGKGIDINLETSNTFYGINCRYNGDNMFAKYVGKDVGRGYFIYNVRNHKVFLDLQPGATNECVLIKTYADSDPAAPNSFNRTTNIEAHISSKGAVSGIENVSLVQLAVQQLTASSVTFAQLDNIKLVFDVQNEADGLNRILTTSKTTNAGTEDTTDRNYVVNNIDISGTIWFATGMATDIVEAFITAAQGSGAAVGDWSADTVTNVRIHDIQQLTAGGWNIGGNAIIHGLTLENIYAPSAALTLNTPVSGALDASRQVNFSNFKSAVASNMTAGSSGYRRLPNGRVEIFGVTTAATSANTVVAFPLTVTQVEAVSLTSANSGEDDSANAVSFTTAGFTISTTGNWGGGAAAWRALARI